LRTGTGHAYWYRVFYPAPGEQSETLICKDGDDDILEDTKAQMAFCGWAAALACGKSCASALPVPGAHRHKDLKCKKATESAAFLLLFPG
jgi:hypothetical protein